MTNLKISQDKVQLRMAEAGTGINAEGSGMMIELERVIDNVTIGI